MMCVANVYFRVHTHAIMCMHCVVYTYKTDMYLSLHMCVGALLVYICTHMYACMYVILCV